MSPCPIAGADRRLRDAFHLWGRVERDYFNPYEFRVALNGFIQEARNVTWILQKAKATVPGFDSWYADKQAKMRADPVMRWIVDSRNRVTKQGDLETESSCTVSFINGWTEESMITVSANPFAPSIVLGRAVLNKIPREVITEESLLCIERRWVDRALPKREILDATSHGLIVLSALIEDAHSLIAASGSEAKCELRQTIKRLRESYPLDLAVADDNRKVWLGAHRLTPIKYSITSQSVENVNIDDLKARMADRPAFEKQADIESLDEGVRFFIYSAKQMLQLDGRALSFIFALRSDTKSLEVLGLAPEDRVGKHIAIRQAAVVLSRMPILWALLVGEAWISRLEPGQLPTRHAADDPEREEGLTVNGVSADGVFRNGYVKFSRFGGNIVFGSEHFDSEPTNLMLPVLAAIKGRT